MPCPITVVVPTRDRGDNVVTTLRTVLASDYDGFEVLVVDQSEDHATEIALTPWSADVRIAYTRTATRGLSAALNDGIARARSDVIAITGDDCDVRADWLGKLGEGFAAGARAPIDRARR